MRLKIEDRYTTASDFAHDVERWLADEPVTVYAGSWNERLRRWLRKHRTKVLAIGVSFAVTTLVAVVSSVLINNQKQLAVQEFQRAGTAERIAVSKTAQAERSAYTSDMLLASVDWENANLGRLRATLDRHRERRDLRGFEWSYHDRLASSHLLAIQGHTKPVVSVSFSPAGWQLASASMDGTVRLWNVATGQETLTLLGHTKGVSSVSFSPNGKWLVSASADRTVKLWDATTGRERLTLQAHTQPVISVSFSPNGKRLASASIDTTVALWDAAIDQETLTLNHTGAVRSVSFSPDGKRLATASVDKTVKVWDARPWTPELRAQSHGRGLLTSRRSQVTSLNELQEVIRSDQTISDQARQQALEWSPLFWDARQ